jgi:phage baseplate assembly protein W
MNVDFPLHVDRRGRTAEASDEKHICDLIEQVVFTAPGERVNRPDFGSGVMQLVFAPNNEALAAATQIAVQSAIQQFLGDLVEVEGVQVTSEDAKLSVLIQYVIRRTQERRITEFSRAL